MTFKKKVYLVLSVIFLFSIYSYSVLIDYKVVTHQKKGRIVNVEKKLWMEEWKLTIFSEGEVFEIEIEDQAHLKNLQEYNKKYILVNFNEFYIRGPIKSKYRLESWQEFEEVKATHSLKPSVLKKLDHNLTCAFIAQLRNNKELNQQVLDYLESENFNIEKVSKICGI